MSAANASRAVKNKANVLSIDTIRVLKDLPNVLSFGDDLYLALYVQPEESDKAHVLVQMNLISFVLSGRKELYHHSGKLVLEPGSGFFIRKGAYLMSERLAASAPAYEAITILFSDEWLQAEADELLQQPGSGAKKKVKAAEAHDGLTRFNEDALVTALTTQYRSYFTGTITKERLLPLIPLKIRELLQVLLSAPENKGFAIQLKRISETAHFDFRQLMETHFREHLSLEQYAFLANCSLSTFKRKFEQQFQVSPKKWIQQRRLEEAYGLLGKAGMNVREVAYEVGFENPAHFITSFKEQYRITPKQLQQQLLTA